jgi:hypothetical protein
MKYQHKTLNFFISRNEYKNLSVKQKSDFVNLHQLKKAEEIYQLFFRHFAMRLMERYNISITYEEYVSLCQLKYIQKQEYIVKENQKPFLKGFIFIKDTRVMVYRDIGWCHQFLTALPKHAK